MRWSRNITIIIFYLKNMLRWSTSIPNEITKNLSMRFMRRKIPILIFKNMLRWAIVRRISKWDNLINLLLCYFEKNSHEASQIKLYIIFKNIFLAMFSQKRDKPLTKHVFTVHWSDLLSIDFWFYYKHILKLYGEKFEFFFEYILVESQINESDL